MFVYPRLGSEKVTAPTSSPKAQKPSQTTVPETCDALKLRPSGSVGYSTILWLYYCIIYSTLMVKIWENDDMLI